MFCKSCKDEFTEAELQIPQLINAQLCFVCYVESISGSEVAELPEV